MFELLQSLGFDHSLITLAGILGPLDYLRMGAFAYHRWKKRGSPPRK